MSYVDEVRVWCRHCCGTGKERFDRRNPCDCDECHGRGYTAVWPTDEQRNAALRERDLRAELAEARRSAAHWEETAGRCSDAGGVCYTNMRAAMTALGAEGVKRLVAVRAAKMWKRRWAGVRRNMTTLSAEVGALRIEVVEQDERLDRYDQAATMWRESRPNERAEVLADLRAFGAEPSPVNYQRAADVLAALEVDRG